MPEGNKPRQQVSGMKVILVRKLGDVLAALEEL